jgi:hypothetical protein
VDNGMQVNFTRFCKLLPIALVIVNLVWCDIGFPKLLASSIIVELWIPTPGNEKNT